MCLPVRSARFNSQLSVQHGSPSIDTAPHQFGEHNREVLLEAGYSNNEISQMEQDGII